MLNLVTLLCNIEGKPSFCGNGSEGILEKMMGNWNLKLIDLLVAEK